MDSRAINRSRCDFVRGHDLFASPAGRLSMTSRPCPEQTRQSWYVSSSRDNLLPGDILPPDNELLRRDSRNIGSSHLSQRTSPIVRSASVPLSPAQAETVHETETKMMTAAARTRCELQKKPAR